MTTFLRGIISGFSSYRLNTAINICGLAVSLAAFLLMFLYVQHEYSYDRHWDEADNLYRLNMTLSPPNAAARQFPFVSVLAAPVLSQSFPDSISAFTRLNVADRMIRVGDTLFSSELVSVDSSFTDLFSLDVLAGSLEGTLNDPASIALSESEARRYFGTSDASAIGRQLTVVSGGSENDYSVSAVYRVPGNTILDLPMLHVIDDADPSLFVFDWLTPDTYTYVRLKGGVDVNQINQAMAAFVDQNADISGVTADPGINASEVVQFDLQNIRELYLNTPWDDRTEGDISVLLTFSLIAVLVLLIASINFMILNTAVVTHRIKEVMLRKIIGASRSQLIGRFLAEYTLLVVTSLVIAIGLVELSLPIFSNFVGAEIEANIINPHVLAGMGILLGLTVLLGGVYPALVASWFKPAHAVKGEASLQQNRLPAFSRALLVFQYSSSIALMIATAVIFSQLSFIKNRDPGFNPENLLVLERLNRPGLFQQKAVLRQELLSIPEITEAGFGGRPSQGQGGALSYEIQGENRASYSLNLSLVGYDFLKTYQIPIVAGRDYSLDLDTQSEGWIPGSSEENRPLSTVIINEGASRVFGFTSPEAALGEIITLTNPVAGRSSYSIVGVAQDVNFQSVYAEPVPMVYHLAPPNAAALTIRYQGSADDIQTRVTEVWQDVMRESELFFGFVEQLIAEETEAEETQMLMLLCFSLLAVFIASIGLFGLARFSVNRRTKEIGIRKVMGAEIHRILALFLWQFTQPVIVANIIAWPLATWIMLRWLQQFSYQIDTLLLLPLCLFTGLVSLVIAWSTVAGSTYKTASAKPVLALRYE